MNSPARGCSQLHVGAFRLGAISKAVLFISKILNQPYLIAFTAATIIHLLAENPAVVKSLNSATLSRADPDSLPSLRPTVKILP